MSKHTPGPWESHPDDFGTIHGSTHYSVIGDGVKVLAYAIAFTNGKEILEHKANARLIAAAPDLLEALERVCEDAEAYFEREEKDRCPWRSVRCYARAAIAEAKGEDQ